MDGLKDSEINATVVAGAALMGNENNLKSHPKDAFSGTIASFVAKAAENAARSAQADIDDQAATSAWNFAMQAATSVEAAEIIEGLNADFMNLYRAAIRGEWTDRTRIPTKIWTML